ncbi:rRNA adenine methyltransferase [Spirosoma sp. SC4-14]|uniref:rRNA adenine methyltransferase n=1 Tax=Spirosoma sp. SC4-14 TaxID=3128900 RepID=UPI0030D27156
MQFDPENNVVKLCAQGMAAEGEPEKARLYFQQAWNEATTNFERFIAAHYVARQQPAIADKLKWDETSLELALTVQDEQMQEVYPSLYLNIGKGYEDLGDFDTARNHYRLAESFAINLPEDGYSTMIRNGIRNGLDRVGE